MGLGEKTFFSEFGTTGKDKVKEIMRGTKLPKGKKLTPEENLGLKSTTREHFPDFSVTPTPNAEITTRSSVELNREMIFSETIHHIDGVLSGLKNLGIIDNSEYREIITALLKFKNDLVRMNITEKTRQTPDTETQIV